jgi:endonuclease-3
MRNTLSDEILNRLRTSYDYTERRRDPFRVLISTILSQRTKNENTEKAAHALFSRFSTVEDIAHAALEEIELLIKPAGFYRVKARRIKKAAAQVLTQFHGDVPCTMEELLSLEGVGRKTANCVLVYGFGISAIPVDVHVHRIAKRLDLVSTRTPEETEQQLMQLFCEEDWSVVNQLLVSFGRDVCKPRTPLCDQCFLSDLCATGQKVKQQTLR